MVDNNSIICDEIDIYKTSPWLPNQCIMYISPANDDGQYLRYIKQNKRSALLKNKKWWNQANDEFLNLMCKTSCVQRGELSRFGDFECYVAYLDKNSRELLPRTEEIDADEKAYMSNNRMPLSEYIDNFKQRKPSKADVSVVADTIGDILESEDKDIVRDIKTYLEDTYTIHELVSVGANILTQLVPKVRELNEDEFLNQLRERKLSEVLNDESYSKLKVENIIDYNIYINKLRNLFENNLTNKLVQFANPNFSYEPLLVDDIECNVEVIKDKPDGATSGDDIDDFDAFLLNLLNSGEELKISVFNPSFKLMDEYNEEYDDLTDDDDRGSIKTIDSTDDEEYEVPSDAGIEDVDNETNAMCRKCGKQEILPFKSVLWDNGRPIIVHFCSIQCIEDLDWSRHKLRRKK